jgi:hypothetical protein
MEFSKSKTKTIAIITIILMMTSVMFMAMPIQPVKAQYTNVQEGGSVQLPAGVTPDYRVTTQAFLSFRPNPVGLGQTILVNLWSTPPLHASRYYKDYKVTVTKPDGTKEVLTMDSFRADTTAWFEYTVDQIGTYKLKFEFSGGYFPAGIYAGYTGTREPGEFLRDVV